MTKPNRTKYRHNKLSHCVSVQSRCYRSGGTSNFFNKVFSSESGQIHIIFPLAIRQKATKRVCFYISFWNVKFQWKRAKAWKGSSKRLPAESRKSFVVILWAAFFRFSLKSSFTTFKKIHLPSATEKQWEAGFWHDTSSSLPFSCFSSQFVEIGKLLKRSKVLLVLRSFAFAHNSDKTGWRRKSNLP